MRDVQVAERATKATSERLTKKKSKKKRKGVSTKAVMILRDAV